MSALDHILSKNILTEVVSDYVSIVDNIGQIIEDTGYKPQFIAKKLKMPLSTFYAKRKKRSFDPGEVSIIINLLENDSEEETKFLLDLARERLNEESVTLDEFMLNFHNEN